MFISFNIRTTLLDQVEVETSSACPKCGSNKWLVNTLEGKISMLFGSATQAKATVVCADCGKKIPKRYWNTEVLDLVARKNKEFKPSFRKRFGFILVLLSLFVAIVSYATIDAVIDHRQVMHNANTNFAKCYDTEIKNKWYADLVVGDFILCSKNYDDPGQVFKIKEIRDQTVVLDVFDQYISRTDFIEIDKLNQMTLGEGQSNEYVAKKKYFFQGIIEEASDDVGGPNNFYIQQIKKK